MGFKRKVFRRVVFLSKWESQAFLGFVGNFRQRQGGRCVISITFAFLVGLITVKLSDNFNLMNAANPDGLLIEWLRSGNKSLQNKSMEELYLTHFEKVRKMINSMNGGDEDAQDIFQEAMVLICTRIMNGTFVLTGSLGGYLYHSSRFLWMKALAKNKIKVSGDMGQLDFKGEEDSYQKFAQEAERESLLRRLLGQADKDCRKILSLFYYERLPYEDVVVRMGYASVPVARNKKKACLDKLRLFVKNSPDISNLFYE